MKQFVWILISGLVMSGCTRANSAKPVKSSSQQVSSSKAANTVRYRRQTVNAYWLKYHGRVFFIVQKNQLVSLDSAAKMEAYLSIEREVDLSSKRLAAGVVDGDIMTAKNRVTLPTDYGYGTITIKVPRDFTLEGLTGTSSLKDPLFMHYTVSQVKPLA